MTNKTKVNAIRFVAEITQVKTKADYGIRLVLDLPENQAKALKDLITAYQAGAVLEVAAVPIKQDGS